MGDWKLIEWYEDGRRELFNIRADLGERHDLAAANPGKVRELAAQLDAWRQSVGAKMPTRNDRR
jgi:arylsulfatase A